MSSPRRQAALVATLIAAACGEPADVAFHPIKLDPLASAPSPLSVRSGLTLLASGAACVIDSYWHRVNCIDPGGESVEFGAEGEGPGEFTFPGDVLRGPSGTIGVVDRRLQRLSMFAASGEFLASTGGLPARFAASRREMQAGKVLGWYRRSDSTGDQPLVQAEIDAATGRVEWERVFPYIGDVVSCSTPLSRISRLANGDGREDLLFLACHGEVLVWYADRDAEEPSSIVRSPTYVERYPTDEDVASERRMLQSSPLGSVISEEEIRARPKVWYGPRVVDDRQRFWAVSHWDGAPDAVRPVSYIDMFRLTADGPEYALTLQVADRVVGMDVLGNTLAVLVERDGGGVISERRVDWYDVAAVVASQ